MVTYPFPAGAGGAVDGKFVAGEGFQGGAGGALTLSQMDPPTGLGVVPQASGTTKFTADSTTYWTVAGIAGDGTMTPASSEISYTQGSTPVPVILEWTPSAGASAYAIFRGTSSGTETYVTSIPGGVGVIGTNGKVQFLDDGSIPAGTATPPTVNNTGNMTGGPSFPTYTAPSISATATAIVTGGTIDVGGTGTIRLNPAAAVTGAILQKGNKAGQIVRLVNESANSITFAAVATSNVADGVSDVVDALNGATYVWDPDASTAGWYRV